MSDTPEIPEPPAFDIAALERQSAGSSFYRAMKLLPPAERGAMFAIYAFCRQVDDIADNGDGAREDRAAALDAWRHDLDALYEGKAGGRAAFLAEPVRQFGLKKADFMTVIDGMAMDVEEDIVAPDLATLDRYCDCVASAVGRLSVRAFGMDEEPGLKLAYHLGRALQLTNILRDIDEDAAIGRLYLPREHLEAAGVSTNDPVDAVDDPNIDDACRAVAKLAHEHYAVAEAVLAAKPAGRLVAPRLMASVYGAILTRMEDVGWAPPRRRVSLPKSQMLWLAAKAAMAG